MEMLWVIIAYVLGSVPYGMVFAKIFHGIDPRTAGSCSVGATNVARLCGKRCGAATLLCDILKGAIPVWVATQMNPEPFFVTCVAVAAILGHLFSCFLAFKGGKAVATSIGVCLPLVFFPLLVSCCICLLIIWRSGYVSLGSLTLVTVLPIILMVFGLWQWLPLSLIILPLVVWSHRANIQRLVCGLEKPWQKSAYKEQ